MEGNILSLTEPFPEEEEYIWNPKNARIGDHVARGADGSVVMCKNEGEQTVFYACNPESGSRDKIKVSAEVQNVHALYSGEMYCTLWTIQSICSDGIIRQKN